jgi:hypothetical protein
MRNLCIPRFARLTFFVLASLGFSRNCEAGTYLSNLGLSFPEKKSYNIKIIIGYLGHFVVVHQSNIAGAER